MATPILNERDLSFLLYEWLKVTELTEREVFKDHDRSTFDGAIQTARKVAEDYFLPIRSKCDQQQPEFKDGTAIVVPEIKQAVQAFIDAGLMVAMEPFEQGGMQLPQTVSAAASAYFTGANFGASGYAYITLAAADLIKAHGSESQKSTWLPPMHGGRFFGTMALTEPHAGSGLADLSTSATPNDDGTYRLKGTKIFISGGEQDISDNIVHLVLARIKGAPKGTKGISLFICPKFLLDESGEPAQRNDVHLMGLYHKMGGRAHTSTQLSFGDNDNCVAYLIGEPNQGLRYMFHMMNEARIGVATGAAVMGYAGYLYSLEYARERPQGRPASNRDPDSPPVPIVQHADVRRMLLAQKAYSEAGLALCLYGRRLLDDLATHPDETSRKEAKHLLDVLTPIIKSWPSKWCLQANSLAIQVLGGHGYINEHPVEQLYRDNRLNPIHEGTEGIQAMDLLGRKAFMDGGEGLKLLMKRMQETAANAEASETLGPYANQLATTLQELQSTTLAVAQTMQAGQVDTALANASYYLDAMGHTVVAWIWLAQALIAEQELAKQPGDTEADFYRGKLQACKYFFRYELPQVPVWSAIVRDMETATLEMENEWF